MLKRDNNVRRTDIFDYPEESLFYSHCVEMMVLNRCNPSEILVEFGSGDGMPIISAIHRSKFKGVVQGYEINEAAYRLSVSNIEENRLEENYIIHNRCLFDNNLQESRKKYLVSNPPYLPAPNNKICLPFIYGGHNGAEVTKQAIDLDFETVLLIISSYSSPESIIRHALLKGYHVSDFIISPTKFGHYSSEPVVRSTIEKLRQNNTAFFSENIYLLAGTLFQKQWKAENNLASELIKLMKAL